MCFKTNLVVVAIVIAIMLVVFLGLKKSEILFSPGSKVTRSISFADSQVVVTLSVLVDRNAVAVKETLPDGAKIISQNVVNAPLVRFKASENSWIIADDEKNVNAEIVYVANIPIRSSITGEFYYLDETGQAIQEISGEKIIRLKGDANQDCKVDILDLIFIRQRLNQDINLNDNAKADVNNDGRINILDLIEVRKYLNTAC